MNCPNKNNERTQCTIQRGGSNVTASVILHTAFINTASKSISNMTWNIWLPVSRAGIDVAFLFVPGGLATQQYLPPSPNTAGVNSSTGQLLTASKLPLSLSYFSHVYSGAGKLSAMQVKFTTVPFLVSMSVHSHWLSTPHHYHKTYPHYIQLVQNSLRMSDQLTPPLVASV